MLNWLYRRRWFRHWLLRHYERRYNMKSLLFLLVWDLDMVQWTPDRQHWADLARLEYKT